MSDLSARVEGLSPAKRKLLERMKARSSAQFRTYPPSYAQLRMCFIDQLEPNSALYNMPSALRLTGPLDKDALRRALGEIVRRHEALRTRFPQRGGVLVQEVMPAHDVDVPEVDLRLLPERDREREAARWVKAESARPFDLARGGLIRALLFQLAEENHVLLLNMHHIAGDGWSAGILEHELNVLYAAYRSRQPSPLPDLELQYGDFAMWQRGWLQSDAHRDQLDYWKRQLHDVATVELPTDYPRQAALSHEAGIVGVTLSGELTAAVKQFCRREKATLFMAVLAAFQVALSRYTGLKRFTIGTPIANRNRVETEKLIGCFINTLVLRADVSGEPTFREVLARVRETTLGAYEHQDMPFEKLVEEFSIARDLSRTPLFQVLFSLQNAPSDGFKPSALSASPFEVGLDVAKVEMTVVIVERDGKLMADLKYDAPLFERVRMERLMECFQGVLHGMVSDPDRKIRDASLLPEVERRLAVEEWNRTATPDCACTVIELFEEQAARTPDAVAVIDDAGQTLRYDDLNQRADQLARYLVMDGVGAETRVGICLPRSVEMIVAMLGILKAGGAYVPLDLEYPAERLAFMLADAQAPLVLTRTDVWRQIGVSSYAGRVLEFEQIALEGDEHTVRHIEPRQLAYVIYTSGSTGTPKGVMVSHEALANHLRWRQRAYPLNEADRFLHKASLSFDIAGWEILAPLVAGAGLVLAAPGGQRDAAYLAEAIVKHGVTVVHFNPSMLRAFVDEPAAKRCEQLRHVFCGGEALSPELHDAFREVLPAALHHQYGPTETTVDVLAWDCVRGPERRREHRIPLGRPIDNTSAYVLDEDGELLPIGVAGELYIGGAPLARGYLNRPDLTADRFVPNPFSTGARGGARLYRTGDRVRWRGDGTLEFLGRLDQQVKLRGYRIELGEIEHALESHADVRQAVVVMRDDPPRLVGYVVTAAGARLDGWRGYLHARLPDYMVPASIVELDAFPLTPNGKIDRKQLPRPEGPARGEDWVGPRNPREEILVAVWEGLLQQDGIGVTANFFELGGHSLLAMQLISRVRDAFGVELPLRALFEAPTAAELSERIQQIEEQQRDPARREVPAIEPVSREQALPLSYAQQRLWFIDRLAPGSAAYNIPVALRLRGALNEGALRWSLDELVRRHEVLRMRVAERDGIAVQEIAPLDCCRLEEIDLRDAASGAAGRLEAARQWAQSASAAPFDLASGPLLRMTLLQVEDDEHVLLLVVHHIVSDGWSARVMARELAALYGAAIAGQPSPLTPLAVQYADYAVWQRGWLRGDVLERQVTYWRQQLAGVEALELPTDRERPAIARQEGASAGWALSAETSQRLKALSRREGATVFMTLLAALQILLARYSGQHDIAVGTPMAGRRWRETEDLIGFFVNALVLRATVRRDESFRALLRRVRETVLEGYEYQDVPFEKLVVELQPERSMSRSPLFQVMFAWEQAQHGGSAWQLSGVDISGLDLSSSTEKFDLSVSAREEDGTIRGGLSYRTDLFERASIERLARHYEQLLEAIAHAADQPVGDLAWLSDEERHQVIEAWNQTAAPEPSSTVTELFETQAARTPDALAVADEAQSLPFTELNRRANQLAHYLISQGVGSEVCVGICLPRSVEMIVAMLGIVKAGGAYVPLDPAYPAERLAYILESARMPVVLTRAAVWQPLGVPYAGRAIDWTEAETASAIGHQPDVNPPRTIDRDTLAYAIYTSGSTGTPKGVGVTHRALSNLVAWNPDGYPLTTADRTTQTVSPGFDAGVWEVWPPLVTGASLHIMPDDVRADPSTVPVWWNELGITVAYLVAPLAEAVLRQPWPDAMPLRILSMGGDRMHALDSDRAPLTMPTVINLYGPTECTVNATAANVPWGDDRAPSIGQPINNTQVYVLDASGAPVPVGVAGELFIGGAGLARGYLNRPELTAEKFVPNPFSATPGARLYRTGDRVRWRGDGSLEFLARLDHQIKLRGYRIELGEIEHALRSHEDVRQAVVVLRDDPPRLVAYVVPVEAGRPIAEWRRHLQSRLPDYMMPAALVTLDAFPLNPNGKINRKQLPPPGPADGEAWVGPRNPREELLAGIWEDVLGQERIGVTANFFDLGGHSLLAMQLISRVRGTFGVELPLRALFETPTVAELTEQIARQQDEQREGRGDAIPPLVRASEAGGVVRASEEDLDTRHSPTYRASGAAMALPLSYAQQRLWFLDRLAPGSSAYNVPVAWRLRGVVDRDALRCSLEEIVRRHEVLRARITQRDGEAVQEVAPAGEWRITEIDLRDELRGSAAADAEVDADTVVRREVHAAAAAPFDLASGPLMRVTLWQVDEHEWVLLLVLHHIVTDGWSMRLLAQEMTQLYTARVTGASSPLSALPVQYGDYALWQRGWLQGDVLERQMAYWRRQLAGVEALELPTDYERPAMAQQAGASAGWTLSAETTRKLKALSRRERATVFMTLLAGFQILLARYSGQRDIAVGTPMAGRRWRETEALIGFFVNTLVLRTEVRPAERFGELLRRVRENVLEGYEHQDVPFEKLVEELQPERSLSRSPVFQVMFVLQEASGGKQWQLPGVEISGVDIAGSTEKFDLSVSAVEEDGVLRGGMSYRIDLFAPASMERLARHFERLLEAIAAQQDHQDQNLPVSELAWLPDDERRLMVTTWNETAAPASGSASGSGSASASSVTEMFETQAVRTPDALAVADDAQSLPYAELNRRANQLAHYLVTQGVGPEVRVGICLPRSVEMIVAMLGILKAGGAYVPLDPAYPAERLAFMLADAEVPLVLTDAATWQPLGVPYAGRIVVNWEDEAIAPESEEHVAGWGRAEPEHLAYVIYTSGSTGTPKGVGVTHRGLSNLIAWHLDRYGVTAADCTTQSASPGFDAAVWEVWPPLTAGASLRILPDDVRADPAAVPAWWRQHGITQAFLPTPLAEAVLQQPWPTATPLRTLMTGGDRLHRLHASGDDRASSVTVVNHYGPTECTVVATAGVAAWGDDRPPAIGQPIANTQVYVLDPSGSLAPIGVAGELHIGGAGLARGYLNRPELTADRFVPDPFSTTPGARLYRTGDRVRWRENGTLEFLGRLDHQVKLRGYRIELGEIEHALQGHADVGQAVVVLRDDPPRLVAYVVPRDEGRSRSLSISISISIMELRGYLQARLPGYMVPAALVALDAFPLTPHGKIDRKRLPPPGPADGEAWVGPRDPREELLAGIWEDVLGQERIGVTANFFDLGGHSLLAMQVISRVRDALGVELPLRALFEMPTVEGLSEQIARQQRESHGVAIPPLVRASEAGAAMAVPLSYAQQRLWFLDQFAPGSSAYNVPVAWRLRGEVDRDALRWSVEEIVRRHEVLRTRIAQRDDEAEAVQEVLPADQWRMTEIDLRGAAADAEEDRPAAANAVADAASLVEQELRAASATPFDLAAGPLMRVTLWQVADDEWVLLLVLHHIVSDGWSMRVLARELTALYTARVAGAPSPLTPLPLQYGDYAVWQRTWLRGDVLDQQMDYWRKQLAGVEALELPADYERPAVTRHAGAKVEWAVSQETTRKLKALSRREGATVFMTLLAGFQLLMARYSGQRDIAVGTPMAGRRWRETEGLTGFFVNTLVLRSEVRPAERFSALLRRVRETVLEGYEHQDVPFEKLVEELHPERSLSRSPLFQVMFVLQEAGGGGEWRLPGVEISGMDTAGNTEKFDLSVSAVEEDGVMRGGMSYRTDLFAAASMDRLARHYERLLEALAAQPADQNLPVSELAWLSDDERHQIVESWNQTSTLDRASTVTEMFEAQAARTPDAVAMIDDAGRTLQYDELDRRANQLARHLMDQGVGVETRVGICVPRSIEMIVALLGILKAGGAYVPLDPEYPAERLAFMLADAQAPLVLTQAEAWQQLDVPYTGRVVNLEHAAAAVSEGRLGRHAEPEHLAYVIYTSGSTGTPKGVMVSHEAFANHLQWRQRVYPLSESDRFLHKASLSFDIAGWEIFAPLVSGARLVLAAPGGQRDAAYLAEAIVKHGVTVAHFNPSMLRAFVDEPGAKRCEQLRHVFCGGEVLSAALHGAFRDVLPMVALHHQYGPTETTVDVLAWDCVRGQHEGRIPIGRPIDNTTAYVLDADAHLVPVGVAGELYIGGAALARGYLNRPDLTADRFIPDPFTTTATAGARLYRTGDRVRWRDDGALEFIGRLDQQVKLRGYRIELGEIEHALESHADVRQAVVVMRDDPPRLVGYVLTTTGAPLDGWRGYLQARLPDYMTPAAVVTLDAFPLTPNGKVNRKQLPAPAGSGNAEDWVAPRNPHEELLAGIWEDVLRVDGVSVAANFFDLGGHSLLAMQLISRVRTTFGVELPLRTLFEAPTVAGLSERIAWQQDEQGDGRGHAIPPLVGASEDGVDSRRRPSDRASGEAMAAPLSYAQQRLWFLDRLAPGSSAYNIPVAWRLRGALDRDALRWSLEEIVRRHEVLRTRIAQRDGEAEARQEVLAAGQWRITEIDLRGTASMAGAAADASPSASASAELDAIVQQEVQAAGTAPFDLASGPLMRVTLWQVADDEWVLLLVLHHIVSDGWSMRVLTAEMTALYAARIAGASSSPLTPLPVQYGDYAVWQREWLQGEVLERQMAYWRQQLAGVEALDLPTAYERPAIARQLGARVEWTLSAETSQRLKALSRREGATVFMTLLAGFQILLARYSGQRDIAVGTPMAGRRWQETEELIGFFVNTLVLRTEVRPAERFSALLRRVRETVLEGYQYQDVPFEKLVEELQPERSLSRTPLFQVMFALQQASGGQWQLPDVEISGVDLPGGTEKFDLSVAAVDEDGLLHGSMSYRTDLFAPESMERMARHYERLLEVIASSGDDVVTELAWLSDAERHQAVVAWNQTAAPEPSLSVTEMFEARAARMPDALAVADEAASLPYAELNRRADQLAHYLATQGVGSEVRVGICMTRSVDMIVAMLAILKAGGAYVPLDPQYPAERLAFMLADAQVPLVLTNAAIWQPLGVSYAGRAIDCQREAAAIATIAAIAARRAITPARASDPDRLAYVIYTSGSTGTPKGVGITHRGLSNLVAWHLGRYEMTAADRTTQSASPGFDAAVWEVWPPLTAGASLHIMPDDVRADPAAVPAWWRERRITQAFLATPLAEAVLRQPWPEATPLRTLTTGGDQLHALGDAPASSVTVVNHYGPTESTVVATAAAVAWGDRQAPPIGQPIANTQVYVLDASGALAPIGVAGELYIGGAGLARGYLNRPDLTADRFVPNPFSATGGARLYRTGDRVRWRADGSLEFLGRFDHQVKLRGYRIELGEIEHALERHADVRQAVVILRDDPPRLVAYVVTNGAPLDGWRDALQARLPGYMVPAALVVLDAFPLTPNGKVDRRQLPAPDESSSGEAWAGPRTLTEELLAGIWEDVLQQEAVSVTANFFDLGGHSLLAMQLISRVRTTFGVELPLRELFEAPTVAGLSERIARQQDDQRESRGDAIPPLVRASAADAVRASAAGAVRASETDTVRESHADVDPSHSPSYRASGAAMAVPVSYAQQRLWFLDRLAPGSSAYNIPVAWRLRGALDREALRWSLKEIVRRHEVLRTRITQRDGGAVQEAGSADEWRITEIDLRGEPDAAAIVDQDARAASAQPFDLASGPLMRVTLWQVAGDEWVLLLVLHHIVSDGWSMRLLTGELTALYSARVTGAPSPLTPLAVQYGDYAIWQREWLQGDALERQMGYWRKQLAGVEALDLPTDYERPPIAQQDGARVEWTLSPETTRRLKALSRAEGATLFMTLLAGFQVLLARYSGQRDIAIGTPMAGRRWQETEALIGFFVNTLVLRTEVRPAERFSALLRRVRETVLEGYEYQDVPFEKLVEELQPERSLSRGPIFQVMFVLQQASGGGKQWQLPGVEVSGFELSGSTEKFDLSVSAVDEDGVLRGGMSYRTDLFAPASMERLARHFERLLESIAAQQDQDVPVGELAWLSDDERRLLVKTWNETATPACASASASAFASSVTEMFETQAVRTPDALAVADDARSLPYAELNRRANQLAHYLVTQGVGPEVPVGICLARSVEMIVAMLGILKAGGAYVPLDPAYPAERLAFMLADAQVPLVLTNASIWHPLGVSYAGRTVDLEHKQKAAAIARHRDTDVPRTNDPDHLAYVIYTSGSTGTPKGVSVTHRGLGNLVAWHLNRYEVSAADRTTQSASPGFDAAVWEVWPPLTAGASLHIMPDAVRADPAAVPAWWHRQGITQAFLPTPLAEAVLRQQPWPEATPLRTLMTGGDRLHAIGDDRVSSTTSVTVVNHYGPTESSVVATAGTVAWDDRRPPSIGQPIANTQVYVLDATGALSPIGVAGELYIGGIGLARGYLNRPDLTADRFVPNAFSTSPGARLYRTGDRVRWRADGTLEFLGRLDHQVKLRGYRIELGEIEHALERHADVRQAVVIVRDDPPRLVAYVVTTGAPLDGWRDYLQARLPTYMVPAALVVLDAFPLTPNGKVDRRQLPAPASAANEAPAHPRDVLELRLVRIWEEVLATEPVGIRDSFFDIGGHSLLAVQLQAVLEQRLNQRIPLAALFRHPSIEQLADLIRTSSTQPPVPRSAIVEIKPTGLRPPMFFVHGAGGSAFVFTDLARRLHPEQPFLAFQDPRIDDADVDSGDMPLTLMAEEYIAAMRAVQPAGPYALGGWSMGGLIAFEMAHQLEQQGERVAVLALVDSYLPARRRRRSPDDDEDDVVLQSFLQNAGVQRDDLRRPDVRRLFNLYRSHVRAIETYRPPITNLTIHWWSARESNRKRQAIASWKKHAANVLTGTLPGSHFTLLREPHVQVLADELNACLE